MAIHEAFGFGIIGLIIAKVFKIILRRRRKKKIRQRYNL